VFFAELSGVEAPLSTAGVIPELPNRSPFVLVGTTAADLAGAANADSNQGERPDLKRPEQQQTADAATILPTAAGPEVDRLTWWRWIRDTSVWARLVQIRPIRLKGGLYVVGKPHGWGPHGFAAAYRRRFGASPQTNRRGIYAYSRAEVEAVATLLEAEASGEVAA
jgi:hypothetical protein